MKSKNNKNCSYSEKIYTEFFVRTCFFLKYFKVFLTCHHFILKDTEVSFKHIHPY